MKKCCIHQYLNKYTFVPIFPPLFHLARESDVSAMLALLILNDTW